MGATQEPVLPGQASLCSDLSAYTCPLTSPTMGPQEDVQLYLSHNLQAVCTVKGRAAPRGLRSVNCTGLLLQLQLPNPEAGSRESPETRDRLKPEVLALP